MVPSNISHSMEENDIVHYIIKNISKNHMDKNIRKDISNKFIYLIKKMLY